MATDLEREVYKRFVAAAGHPLHMERADAVRALSAVLDQHPHRFMDSFIREIPTAERAHYGACGTCGNVNEQGEVWCRTVRAVASALGVREDPKEG